MFGALGGFQYISGRTGCLCSRKDKVDGFEARDRGRVVSEMYEVDEWEIEDVLDVGAYEREPYAVGSASSSSGSSTPLSDTPPEADFETPARCALCVFEGLLHRHWQELACGETIDPRLLQGEAEGEGEREGEERAESPDGSEWPEDEDVWDSSACSEGGSLGRPSAETMTRTSSSSSSSTTTSTSSSSESSWTSEEEEWSSCTDDELPAVKQRKARGTRHQNCRSPRVRRTTKRVMAVKPSTSTPCASPAPQPTAPSRKRKRGTTDAHTPVASGSGASSTAPAGHDGGQEGEGENAPVRCLWPRCRRVGPAAELWQHVHAMHLPERPTHAQGLAEDAPMVCRWPGCGKEGTVKSVWPHLQRTHTLEQRPGKRVGKGRVVGKAKVVCRLPKCRFAPCTVAKADYRRHVLDRHWRTEKMLPTCAVCATRTRSDMQRRRHPLRACLLLLMKHEKFLRGEYPPHDFPKRAQQNNREKLEDDDIPVAYDRMEDKELPSY